VVTVDLTSQIDTEEVEHAIAALREKEDARRQLIALKEEIDTLHQELESANQALALATTTEEIQQASQQWQNILNHVQFERGGRTGLDRLGDRLSRLISLSMGWHRADAGTLECGARAHPGNPHVQVAQQIFGARQPPAPPQLPTPGATAPTMPIHQITSAPGSLTIPRTLNEISSSATTAAPHIGNQFASW